MVLSVMLVTAALPVSPLIAPDHAAVPLQPCVGIFALAEPVSGAVELTEPALANVTELGLAVPALPEVPLQAPEVPDQLLVVRFRSLVPLLPPQ